MCVLIFISDGALYGGEDDNSSHFSTANVLTS